MFKSGWMRLWLVLTAIALLSVLAGTTYYVWGVDACRKFMSVSVSETAASDDKDVAERIRKELTASSQCGSNIDPNLLTLEHLAAQGVVTQVAFQWLEPEGWSTDTHAAIDILEGKKITGKRIIARTNSYVREARKKVAVVPIVATMIGSLLLLALGHGVAWIRAGFRKLPPNV